MSPCGPARERRIIRDRAEVEFWVLERAVTPRIPLAILTSDLRGGTIMQKFHDSHESAVRESSTIRRLLLFSCCWFALSLGGCAAGPCHDQLATPGDRDRDLTGTGDDHSNPLFFKDEYSAGSSYEPCDWSCRAHQNPGDTEVHAAGGACRCSTRCPCWGSADE